MRRLPASAAAVLAALAAAGCGAITNQPLEDLVFVEALPSAADLAFAGPGDGAGRQALGAGVRRDAASSCDGDSPQWVFCLGHELAYVVNAFTHQTLGIVDVVRRLPPSERGDDFRAWGPYPDDQRPGGRWRLEVRRSHGDAGPSYAWRILLFPAGADAPVEVTDGSFVPGPGGTSRGVGRFTFHGKAARDHGLAAEADPDELAMTYDLGAEPRRVGCRVTGADGTVLDFENDLADDGAGGWSYAVDLAIEADGIRNDLLEVRARWAADRAGRADAQLTLESPRLPAGPWTLQECWGAAPGFSLLYYDNEVQPEVCGAGGCPVGTAAACRFAPLF